MVARNRSRNRKDDKRRPGEFRGSRGLRGCRGRTKNPPNTKSAEFILTLGGNEFRGLCGFQGEMFSQVNGKIC